MRRSVSLAGFGYALAILLCILSAAASIPLRQGHPRISLVPMAAAGDPAEVLPLQQWDATISQVTPRPVLNSSDEPEVTSKAPDAVTEAKQALIRELKRISKKGQTIRALKSQLDSLGSEICGNTDVVRYRVKQGGKLKSACMCSPLSAHSKCTRTPVLDTLSTPTLTKTLKAPFGICVVESEASVSPAASKTPGPSHSRGSAVTTSNAISSVGGVKAPAKTAVSLLVADGDLHQIIKVDVKTGAHSVVAGSTRGFANGPANQAKFDSPLGIAYYQGSTYVTEGGSNAIRRVSPFGVVDTYAGAVDSGARDGLVAVARFAGPTFLDANSATSWGCTST